jgi:hypothetical protein
LVWAYVLNSSKNFLTEQSTYFLLNCFSNWILIILYLRILGALRNYTSMTYTVDWANGYIK